MLEQSLGKRQLAPPSPAARGHETTMNRSPKLPRLKSFPRELVRAAIDELVAEGLPLVSITQTQLRMRLGGGSWQTLRDELERARGRSLGAPKGLLAEQEVPADLAARVTSLERLLAQIGQEVRELRAEIDRLVTERDERRRPMAAADPASVDERQPRRKRRQVARTD